MRLNLRKCREKRFIYPILVLLCFLLCGVVVKNRMKQYKSNIYDNESHLTSIKEVNQLVLPTLVMACNAKHLKRSMQSLSNFRPNMYIFPIIVAPYCSSKAMYEVIESYEWDRTITFLENPKPTKGKYKNALNYVFRILKHKAVIILEDNLDISPDFYEYFLATYPLLKKDPSIWCVSAWNDNCIEGLVDASQHRLLHRTDFFPGKGFMLLSETWDDIEPSLPEIFVEDSMRIPAVTRGRVCIRPELSRTYKFGLLGSSYGEKLTHGHRRNGQRLLNTEFIPFTQHDLSYLLKEQEHLFTTFVYSCPETTLENVEKGNINSSLKFVRIPYLTASNFRKAAKTFGLWDDFRHGVPRTGLYGIVQCFIDNRRVFFTPVRKLFDSITDIKKTNKSIYTNKSTLVPL